MKDEWKDDPTKDDNMENADARIGTAICGSNAIANAASVSHNGAEEMDVDKEMDVDDGNDHKDSLFGPCCDQLKIDVANKATAVTKGTLVPQENNNTISTTARRTKKRKRLNQETRNERNAQ